MSNPEATKQFGAKLVGFYTGSVLTKLIDIGYEVGLFEASQRRPGDQRGAGRARRPEGALRARVAGRDGDRRHLPLRRSNRSATSCPRSTRCC